MNAKLFKGAVVGACLLAGCAVAPGTAPDLSPRVAMFLESTATSARYQTMAVEADSGAAKVAVTHVSASSVKNDYFRLAYVNDGNLHSAWGAASSDAAPTLTYDLAGTTTLSGFAIKQSPGVSMDVAVLVDGGAWETVATGLTSEAEVMDWVDLPTAVEADRVRVTFRGELANQVLVCELDWYGTDAPTPTPSPTPTPTPSVSPTPTCTTRATRTGPRTAR